MTGRRDDEEEEETTAGAEKGAGAVGFGFLYYLRMFHHRFLSFI